MQFYNFVSPIEIIQLLMKICKLPEFGVKKITIINI